jgi:tetratricopeptide (TPR) repeat protein
MLTPLRFGAIRRLLVVLAVFCLSVPWAGHVAGQPASATEQEARAHRLYQEGRTEYDLGNYDRAIELFRESYQLVRAPLLLFNIAQAYRLKRDCRQALDGYRHFARLAPDFPERAQADSWIATLSSECDPASARANPAPAVIPAANARTSMDLRVSNGSQTRRWQLVTLGAGLALGAGAATLARWNGGRYETWRVERERIIQSSPSDLAAQADLLAREKANSDRLHSIRRVDHWTTSMAVAAGVSAATALVLVLLSR